MDNPFLKQEVSYRDLASTVQLSGQRKWIYAAPPLGILTNYRRGIAWLCFILLVLLPLLKFDGHPFMLLNIFQGKFILFGKIFWPQDYFIFAAGMITFIIFIILFTTVFGRLFCGWVCPQTLILEFIFRPIEQWIEGSSNQRIKLDQSEWTIDKVLKKSIKHIIYLLISFFIANIFLAYIVGMDELLKIISEPVSIHLALLSGMIVFTLLFYSIFAFVRDIVCTTICPYGRLQGVITGPSTLQIFYDHKRGEPRGRINKNQSRMHGDCIDCNKCVQVCPTGIDIRNGIQMECVGCTACIDACNNVMQAVHFDKGLIRYATEKEIISGRKQKFDSRLKLYTAICLSLIVIMGLLIYRIRPIDTFINRARGQLYQEENGNRIGNLYDIKVINKTKNTNELSLRLNDDLNGEIKFVGSDKKYLKPEAINEYAFFVSIPSNYLKSRVSKIKINVYADNERLQTIETKFFGPFIK